MNSEFEIQLRQQVRSNTPDQDIYYYEAQSLPWEVRERVLFSIQADINQVLFLEKQHMIDFTRYMFRAPSDYLGTPPEETYWSQQRRILAKVAQEIHEDTQPGASIRESWFVAGFPLTQDHTFMGRAMWHSFNKPAGYFTVGRHYYNAINGWVVSNHFLECAVESEFQLRTWFLHYTKRNDWLFRISEWHGSSYSKSLLRVVQAYRIATAIVDRCIETDFPEWHMREYSYTYEHVIAPDQRAVRELLREDNRLIDEISAIVQDSAAVNFVTIGALFRSFMWYHYKFLRVWNTFYDPSHPVYFVGIVKVLCDGLGLVGQERLDLIAHLWMCDTVAKDFLMGLSPNMLLLLVRGGKLFLRQSKADIEQFQVIRQADSYYQFVMRFSLGLVYEAFEDMIVLDFSDYLLLQDRRSYVHSGIRQVYSKARDYFFPQALEDVPPNDNRKRNQKQMFKLRSANDKWLNDKRKYDLKVKEKKTRLDKQGKRIELLAYEPGTIEPQGLFDSMIPEMKINLGEETLELMQPISELANQLKESNIFQGRDEPSEQFVRRAGSLVSSVLQSTLADLLQKYRAELMSTSVIAVITYAYSQDKQVEGDRWKFIMGACVLFLTIINRDKVSTYVSEVFKKYENQAQSDEVLENIASIILGYVCIESGLSSPNTSWTKKLLGSVKDFDRKSRDLSSFIRWFGKVFQQCVDMVCSSFGLPSVRFMKSGHQTVEVWVNKVQEVMDLVHQGKYAVTIPNFDRVRNLSMEGIDICTSLAADPTTRHLLEMTRPRMTALSRIVTEMDRSGLFGQLMRIEPVAVCISGAPGIGKTRMLLPFVAAMCNMLLPEEDLDNFQDNPGSYIYNRAAEQVFWDGYAGQWCICFDDFGQAKDVAGTPDNEVMNLIRLISNFTYRPHMAGLEEKGKKEITTKVVFATTNLKDFTQVKSINNPAALTRRFALNIEMRPKEQFRVPFADPVWQYTLEPGHKEGDIVDWSIYEWEDKSTGVVYHTVEEILARIRQVHKHNERKYECTMKDVGKFSSLGKKMRNYPQALVSLETLDLEESDDESELSFIDPEVLTSDLVRDLNSSLRRFAKWTKQVFKQFKDFCSNRMRGYIVALWNGFNVLDALYLGIAVFVLRKAYYYFFPPKEEGENKSADFVDLTSHPQVGTAQGLDDTTKNVIRKVLMNSWYDMVVDKESRVHGFFLKERKFFFPAHFVNFCENHKEMKVEIRPTFTNGQSLWVTCQWIFENARTEPISDLACVVFVDATFPQKPDITKFFITEATLKGVDTFKGLMFHSLIDKSPVCKEVIARSMGSVQYGNHLIHRSIAYEAQTNVGDCGLPVFIAERATRCEKIAGFHVAARGDKRVGFGNVLTQEHLQRFCKAMEVVPQAKVETNNSILHIGRVSRKMPYASPTKIIPSLLADEIRLRQKAPAMLCRTIVNGVVVDPMEKALKGYDVPITKYQEDMLEAAAAHLFATLDNSSTLNEERKRGVISLEEAVAGIPDDPNYAGMNWQTSAGYPWCKNTYAGFQGKERWFGKEGKLDKTTKYWQEFQEACFDLEESCKKGVRKRIYALDMLKDELVSLTKAVNGKTRMICPTPFDYCAVFLKYFKAFQVWLMQNRVFNGCGVGINEYSGEWEMLWRVLHTYSNYGFDGDFSGFDKNLMAQVLKIMVRFINDWYDDEYGLVREILWMEVYNSFHVCGSNVYEWLASLPSGHPFTIIINCLANHILFRMVWILVHDGKVSSVRTFNDHVILVVTGDDNILNLDEYAQESFNQHVVTIKFKELGMTYTDSQKSTDFPRFKKMEELTFLKRGFRYEKQLGRTVAPLSIDTILEMPMWTKRGLMSDQITRQKVDQALHELSLHDDEVFLKWAPVIIQASIKKLGYTPLQTAKRLLLMEVDEWGGSQKEIGRYRMQYGISAGEMSLSYADQEGVVMAESQTDNSLPNQQ